MSNDPADDPAAALSGPWSGMDWLNPPPRWSVGADGALHAATGPRTDFWQRTFYGFQRDDGHALLRPVEGEWTAGLTVQGECRHLYDQAGLMIRVSPMAWIKLGVEYTDGAAHLSCVVTRGAGDGAGASDWSAMPIAPGGPVALRATRLRDAVLLQYDAGGGGVWAMARLAPMPGGAGEAAVGPYLCSPEREGFEARFAGFAVTEPQVRGLHA